MKSLALLLIFSLIWILLSGYFELLLLGFGAVSILFVLFILKRMRASDETPIEFKMNLFKLTVYFFWLSIEVIKANIVVCKIILSPKIKVNQNMIDVSLEPDTEVGQVIFANSITLTPGTVTVDTGLKSLAVHSLDLKKETLGELEKMGQYVKLCETKDN